VPCRRSPAELDDLARHPGRTNSASLRIYIAGVAATIHGAGVTIRLATADEVEALERARLGGDLVFEPSRSFRGVSIDYPPAEDGVYVVGQAFVEFSDGDGAQRWESGKYQGGEPGGRRGFGRRSIAWRLMCATPATTDAL